MSDSPETCVTVEEEEEVPLNLIPGLGVTQNNGNRDTGIAGQRAAICWDDRNHRKLAICSIICGISCIGIKALINSVKAEQTKDPAAAALFSRQAKRFGIISIVTWVAILVSVPVLMALISYLLTLGD